MWTEIINTLYTVRFEQPAWLWLWLISALLLGLLIRYGTLALPGYLPDLFHIKHFRHTRLDLIQEHLQQAPSRKHAVKPVLHWLQYVLLFLLLHIALAQPYKQGKQLPEPPAYRDTIFMVDTSISMLLKDYLVDGKRVDRMTMMKSVLHHFITRLEGNRIGVIAFSEQVYTLVPLTDDYELLKVMIRRLQPAVLTGRTSHPGKALLYTLQQLRQTQIHDNKPVLVLVSDVNRPDREIDPAAVSGYLKQQGYRVHTIGIGAGSYKAGDTEYRGLIFHPASFNILKSIATEGDGKFYWADNAASLREALLAIQSGERHKIEAAPRFIQIPLYHWPLLLALFGIFLQQLVTWRHRT
ncbi:MAG: VWA domain-containing protein [Gammaproteobacteria bacterium]|nr:VWA domain-containing protein [Gammaproteobacteria bacterium]MDH5652730.1 VWA domain-containing protein [Gammaproteobacteria bacterium]